MPETSLLFHREINDREARVLIIFVPLDIKAIVPVYLFLATNIFRL